MGTKGHWLRLLGIGAATSALVIGATSSGWAGTTAWGAQDHKNVVAQNTTTASAKAVKAGERNQMTSVTLVTGDRVLLSGKKFERKAVIPAPGRKSVKFRAYTKDGRLHVVPSDVRRLVQSGRLDSRLFDVTGLIEQKYDDKHSKSLGLIVESSAAKLRDAGLRPGRSLPAIDSTSTKVAKKDLATSWKRLLGTGAKVWLDARRKINLSESVPQIGAPKAWGLGYTGKGLTVGIVDTGVDATHADLAGKVVESKDFTGEGNKDIVGHGTHVASIVAGTGAASSGKYKGVAPDAKVVSAKVCFVDGCLDSDMIEGMRWVAATKKARVVNISIGGYDTPEQDPVEKALNSLTKETGTLFVVSAGNGSDFIGVESPASADSAAAVGAVDKQDKLAIFSGIGPRHGDNGIKPDLTAPGVDIAAARAAGTSIGDPVNASYTKLSGTSMAAPHVTGSAALLAQSHPDWKAAQIKNALTGGAAPQPGQGLFEQGAGRVDIGRAITQNVVASAPSLSFGIQQWPHNDDAAVSRGLVYTNYGKDPVTLDLTAAMLDRAGNAAPEGALKLSVSKLEVPAGGTARVAVTSSTNHAGADGQYTGAVTAASGDLRLLTPVAVNKEVESYNITVKNIDRSGAPADDGFATFDGDRFQTDVQTTNGVGTIRLPKGEYLVNTEIFEGSVISWLVRPKFVVSKEETITADARLAKPLKVGVPRAGSQYRSLGLAYERVIGDSSFLSAWFMDGPSGFYTASLGGGTADSTFQWSLNSTLDHPDAGGISPYAYVLHFAGVNKFITGFSKVIAADSELAKVTNYYAQQKAGHPTFATFVPPWGAFTSIAVRQGKSLTAYVSPGTWGGWLEQYSTDFEQETSYSGPNRVFGQGKSYSLSWNKGPFNPAFPNIGGIWADRFEGTIWANLPLYSDQAGNAGFSFGTGTTTLYRNNVKVGASPYAGYGEFPVADGAARFRLSTEDKRNVSDFTTTMSASWTFDQSGADAPLALWAIRFRPSLDAYNKTAGGRLGELPISMQANPGATVGTPTLSTLEVSFDDGRTWARAGFKSVSAGHWLAKPTYPSATKSKFVSLRATGKDSAGNVVSVKLIRAYGLK